MKKIRENEEIFSVEKTQRHRDRRDELIRKIQDASRHMTEDELRALWKHIQNGH